MYLREVHIENVMSLKEKTEAPFPLTKVSSITCFLGQDNGCIITTGYRTKDGGPFILMDAGRNLEKSLASAI